MSAVQILIAIAIAWIVSAVLAPKIVGRLRGDDKKLKVSAEQTRLLMDAGAVLVDVRTKLEFDNGHIPGALNIPLHELKKRLEEIPKEGGVVVYCQSGGRSRKAAIELLNAGREAFDLGAMRNWG